MIFIIGGAYQGKLEYAKKSFEITDEDIYICGTDMCTHNDKKQALASDTIASSANIDFTKRCIYGIEQFSATCNNPIEYFESHKNKWKENNEKLLSSQEIGCTQETIFIMQDIFCGVVPIDAKQRAWRQRTGRLAQYLNKEATKTVRIFCGLEQRLK